jgi:hypothetical protein
MMRQLLVIVGLLGILMAGCQSIDRQVAKLHGYQGDPFPGPCVPNVATGQCVPVAQRGQ